MSSTIENEVIIDRLYFGEVTAVTLEHIQQAGFEFDGNSTFTKIESAQEEIQENIEMYYQPSSEQKAEPQAEQKTEPQTNQESEPQAEQEPEPQAEQKTEKKAEPQTVHKAEPEKKPVQGGTQTADAGKQSDLVKFSGLSGTHIQALKESNIHFWVKREPDNSFSAYFHRPDVEQAKGVLSSVAQIQKKTASQSRQQTKPKR